jgi:hypothetical protein
MFLQNYDVLGFSRIFGIILLKKNLWNKFTTAWTGSMGPWCRNSSRVIQPEIYDLDFMYRKGIYPSNLGCTGKIGWRGSWLRPGGGADSRSRRRAMVERGGSPEFMFSRAMVVGF